MFDFQCTCIPLQSAKTWKFWVTNNLWLYTCQGAFYKGVARQEALSHAKSQGQLPPYRSIFEPQCTLCTMNHQQRKRQLLRHIHENSQFTWITSGYIKNKSQIKNKNDTPKNKLGMSNATWREEWCKNCGHTKNGVVGDCFWAARGIRETFKQGKSSQKMPLVQKLKELICLMPKFDVQLLIEQPHN